MWHLFPENVCFARIPSRLFRDDVISIHLATVSPCMAANPWQVKTGICKSINIQAVVNVFHELDLPFRQKNAQKEKRKKTCCQETFFCCSNEATVYKAMFRFTQQLSKFGRRSHLKFFQRGRGVGKKHPMWPCVEMRSAEERRNLEKCCPKHQKVSLETQKVKQNRQTSLC